MSFISSSLDGYHSSSSSDPDFTLSRSDTDSGTAISSSQSDSSSESDSENETQEAVAGKVKTFFHKDSRSTRSNPSSIYSNLSQAFRHARPILNSEDGYESDSEDEVSKNEVYDLLKDNSSLYQIEKQKFGASDYSLSFKVLAFASLAFITWTGFDLVMYQGERSAIAKAYSHLKPYFIETNERLL